LLKKNVDTSSIWANAGPRVWTGCHEHLLPVEDVAVIAWSGGQYGLDLWEVSPDRSAAMRCGVQLSAGCGRGEGILCDPLFRTRFSQGDFVGGGRDGAQENRDGTGIAPQGWP